ncbi:hypothetical protein LCGC14_1211420 [marine sediment metagenome]|uniref:Uncharacterized protein n=1 Tax=marine sediment metagenome TaxID=412755 RepID=A0A0F9PII0_9ZZZZ
MVCQDSFDESIEVDLDYEKLAMSFTASFVVALFTVRSCDMLSTEKIVVASCIAHLLEYIDTEEVLDYGAAMSLLQQSGLIEWAQENAVLLPMRRDGKNQAERFNDAGGK